MLDLDHKKISPIVLFSAWLAEAEKAEPNDANAAAVATCDATGHPTVRILLVKGVSEDGFTFYTNFNSRKGDQLKENPQASFAIHWKSLKRQIVVDGHVEFLSDEESDDYFNSRDRMSQVGANISRQSRPMQSREVFEKELQDFAKKYEGQDIPRPPHWGGFRIVPERIEFWQQMDNRLHDRYAYIKDDGGLWRATRLYP